MCGNVWETHTPNLAHFALPPRPECVVLWPLLGFFCERIRPTQKNPKNLPRLWTKWSYNPKNQQGSSFLWRGECTWWSAHSKWRRVWAGFGFLRQHGWYGKTPETRNWRDKLSNSKWFWDVLNPCNLTNGYQNDGPWKNLSPAANMTSFWVSMLHFRHGLKPVSTEKKKNRLSCLVIMLPTFLAVFLGATSPNHQPYFPQTHHQSNKSYIIPHYCTPIGNCPRFANYGNLISSWKRLLVEFFFHGVIFSSVCWKQRTPSLEHDQISSTINSYPFSHKQGSVENSPKWKETI